MSNARGFLLTQMMIALVLFHVASSTVEQVIWLVFVGICSLERVMLPSIERRIAEKARANSEFGGE